MGMFDTVYIERQDVLDTIKKIVKDKFSPDFQTKDLENMLFVYRVTDYGLEAETYKIGNCTLPFMIKESKGWKKLEYTTTLNLYTHTTKGKGFDLLLEFFRGKLTSYSIFINKKRYDYQIT